MSDSAWLDELERRLSIAADPSEHDTHSALELYQAPCTACDAQDEARHVVLTNALADEARLVALVRSVASGVCMRGSPGCEDGTRIWLHRCWPCWLRRELR